MLCLLSAKGFEVMMKRHNFMKALYQRSQELSQQMQKSSPEIQELFLPTQSMAVEPPFFEKYKAIFQSSADERERFSIEEAVNEEVELPLIDLNQLNQGPTERQKCLEQMAEAATEFGFFQVINHGIPEELLARLKLEQIKVFRQPFDKKAGDKFLNLPAHSYRWGNPMATSLRNLSWSEALHISLSDVWRMDEWKLRSTIEEYAKEANSVAQTLAECLAERLGMKATYFQETCSASSSSLRMNRYPPCPFYSSKMFGIVPHTDTDFLTILSQDQVGGLQLKRDGRWLCVKPNSNALVINIGDLFQALSNGVYKSITHRVVARRKGTQWRTSTAPLGTPSYIAAAPPTPSRPYTETSA